MEEQWDNFDGIIGEASEYMHKKLDEKLNEGEQQEKQRGSLNKLVEILKKKKDDKSKNMLKMAKGMLKTLKKNDGLSSEQAEWLYKTWTSFSANNS